jgi:hypothetical protein
MESLPYAVLVSGVVNFCLSWLYGESSWTLIGPIFFVSAIIQPALLFPLSLSSHVFLLSSSISMLTLFLNGSSAASAIVVGAPITATINNAIDGSNNVIVPRFTENLDKSSFI